MKVRCKFFVKSIQHLHGMPNVAEIKLAPVYDGGPDGNANENKWFSKWTPQGEISLTITNPEAVATFDLSKPYYVDFTPAD